MTEFIPQIIIIILAVIFLAITVKKLDNPIKKSEEQTELNNKLLSDIMKKSEETNELLKEIANNQKIQNELLKKISDTPVEQEKKKLIEKWKQATEIINNLNEN